MNEGLDDRRPERGAVERIDYGKLALGAAVAGSGGLLLLDRWTWLEIGGLWRLFPLLIAAVGAVKLLSSRGANERHSGLWLIGIASWLLVNVFGLYGLSWHNSWPLVVILAGTIDLLQPREGEPRWKGIWPFGIGFWLLASNQRWGGLDWNNSWPILLIVVGIAIVTRALVEGATRRQNGAGGFDGC